MVAGCIHLSDPAFVTDKQDMTQDFVVLFDSLLLKCAFARESQSWPHLSALDVLWAGMHHRQIASLLMMSPWGYAMMSCACLYVRSRLIKMRRLQDCARATEGKSHRIFIWWNRFSRINHSYDTRFRGFVSTPLQWVSFGWPFFWWNNH